jgi:hypothetical protein
MAVVTLTNAYDQTGLLKADIAAKLYNNGEYFAAATEFRSITAASARLRKFYNALSEICGYLSRWDAFDFTKDAAAYENLS